MTKLDDRVTEWEAGLPGPDELTPLSQMLITPELACAFSISPEPCRTLMDVNRASQSTVSDLRRQHSAPASLLKGFQSFPSQEHGGQAGADGDGAARRQGNQAAGVPLGGEGEAGDGGDGSFKKGKKQGERETEEADSSSFGFENSAEEQSARTLKRPRLVWTPQLHKRFVDVVAHLGIKNAVPKTIMQLMNVEGLTRENVASHLQKYRLYLKRMQGLSNEGPSPSDQLFASTPVPHNLAASSFLPNHRDDSVPLHMPMPMPFASPVVPMHPVVGIAHPHGHGHVPVPMNAPAAYAGFDPHAYGTVFARMPPQRMPSGDQRELVGDIADSSMSYPHAVPRE